MDIIINVRILAKAVMAKRGIRILILLGAAIVSAFFGFDPGKYISYDPEISNTPTTLPRELQGDLPANDNANVPGGDSGHPGYQGTFGQVLQDGTYNRGLVRVLDNGVPGTGSSSLSCLLYGIVYSPSGDRRVMASRDCRIVLDLCVDSRYEDTEHFRSSALCDEIRRKVGAEGSPPRNNSSWEVLGNKGQPNKT